MMAAREVRLLWQDGSITKGTSWADAENRARRAQWVPYKTRIAFRRDMRNRAKTWSGGKVPIHGSSEAFLRGLEAAGFLRVMEEGE